MWSLCGIYVESMWSLCGVYVESLWNLFSFHVEFGHSIIIPCGLQMEWRPQNEWDPSQNIFHMEA